MTEENKSTKCPCCQKSHEARIKKEADRKRGILKEQQESIPNISSTNKMITNTEEHAQVIVDIYDNKDNDVNE